MHAAERTAAKLLTGADLLLAVGSYGLHYHLWASLGYRHLLTIGPLFVVPAVVGMVLAVRAGAFGTPLLLAAEAGFALSSARPIRAVPTGRMDDFGAAVVIQNMTKTSTL
jgi:hypothetical protein